MPRSNALRRRSYPDFTFVPLRLNLQCHHTECHHRCHNAVDAIPRVRRLHIDGDNIRRSSLWRPNLTADSEMTELVPTVTLDDGTTLPPEEP